MEFEFGMLTLLTEWDPSAKQDELVRFFHAQPINLAHILVVDAQGPRFEKHDNSNSKIAQIYAKGEILILFTANEQQVLLAIRNHIYNAAPHVEQFQRSLERVAYLQSSEMNEFDQWLLSIHAK